MITEKDLQEAIAECQGQRNPNASVCIKLAAFLTIQRELYGNTEPSQNEPITPRYSYAADPQEQVETTIDYYSDTEFAKAIDGKQASEVWPVIDELMEVLRVTTPRLYSGVMRKIQD